MMSSTDLRASQYDDFTSSSTGGGGSLSSSSSSSIHASTDLRSSVPHPKSISPPSARLDSSSHSLHSSSPSIHSPHHHSFHDSNGLASSSSSSHMRTHASPLRHTILANSAYNQQGQEDVQLSSSSSTTSTSLASSNALVASSSVKVTNTQGERDIMIIIVHGTSSECWNMTPFSDQICSFASQLVAPRKITHKTYFDWAKLCDNEDLEMLEMMESGYYSEDDVFHRPFSSSSFADHVIRKSEEMDVVIVTHSHGTSLALRGFLSLHNQINVSAKVHMMISIYAPKSYDAIDPLLATSSIRPARWINIFKYGDLVSFLGSSKEGRLPLKNAALKRHKNSSNNETINNNINRTNEDHTIINTINKLANGDQKLNVILTNNINEEKSKNKKKGKKINKADLLSFAVSSLQSPPSRVSLSEHYLYEPAINVMSCCAPIFHPFEHSIATFFEKELPRLKKQQIATYLCSVLSSVHCYREPISKNQFINPDIFTTLNPQCPQEYTYYPALCCFSQTSEFTALQEMNIDPGVEYTNPILKMVSWLFGGKAVAQFDMEEDDRFNH